MTQAALYRLNQFRFSWFQGLMGIRGHHAEPKPTRRANSTKTVGAGLPRDKYVRQNDLAREPSQKIHDAAFLSLEPVELNR